MPLDRVAFITEVVVGCKSFGISFTANCMHGRSTTIFWVEDVVGNEPRHLWEQYGAFQRSRKNSDPHQSNRLQQVHPYARGIKHAQHFSVALTVTRNELALLRGESSDTERLELALPDGRGCIKLIQILLGIALAEGGNLGQNSDVDLATSPPTTAPSVQVSYRESKFTASSSQTHSAPASLSTHDISQPVLSSSGKAPHTSDASVLLSAAASSNSKSDDGDDVGGVERKPSKKAKMTHVPRVAFIPVAVHCYNCLWILFTAGSISGVGTALSCAVDLQDALHLLALKMSWQDLERGAEQDEVLETLGNRNLHDHLVVPFKSFKASRKNETCKTLGAIRAFLDDQLAGLPVEHHVLKVSLSELKRPVKYFWGVHDFVRGVRGAVLGHQYLTSIGVLHRDISENNIVLARHPGEERGYLIDLDMAILQEPEKPTEPTVRTKPKGLIVPARGVARSSSPIPSDETKPIKPLRTGTIPYMPFNILHGRRHTHFDDMESFLYVVFLFFFSYAGPLSKEELRDADARGFVQPTGSGQFTHMRRWPNELEMWSKGGMRQLAKDKDANLATQDGVTDLLNHPEVKHCLRQNWASGLQDGIDSLLLSLWTLFAESRIFTGMNLPRTQVTHDDFIGMLDEWLEVFHETEQEFSNCPFT